MPEFERLVVKIVGDSNLDKTFDKDSKAAGGFEKKLDGMYKKYGNRKITLEVEEDGAASTAASLKGVDKVADSLDGRNVEITVDKDGKATDKIGGLSEGFKGLASNIRATGTVLAAAAIPFAIAGVGAGIPTVTALGASFGGLALNLGKAATGFGLVAGAAAGGALVGLKAYSAILSRTVSDSRAAYEATHEAAVKQLEMQRNTILNTKASTAFNEELNRQAIGLTKLEAAVGSRVFPMFTKEIRAWGGVLSSNKGEIVDTAGAVAGAAVGFAKWFRTAEDGKVLNRTLGFINSSAIKGANIISALGAAGVMAFQPLIPLASRLQERVLGVLGATNQWLSKSDNQKKLAAIYRDLYDEAKRLGPVLMDLGRGVVNTFSAIDQAGLSDQASRGLARIASGFEHVTRKGTESRQKLDAFMQDTKRLMPSVGGAVMAFVGQLGRIAGEAIKVRQEGHKLTILQEIFRGIEKSAKPLGNLISATFEDLGPEIAKLIPNLSRLAENFAGSNGPLVAFVHLLNRALNIFNNLPQPLKTAATNFATLKLILGTMGITPVIGAMGHLTANMWAVNKVSRSVGGKTGALGAVAGSLGKIGLVLAGGIGLAAVAGAFYLAYKNSDKFHDQVNKLASELQAWGKTKFAQAKTALRDIFDIPTGVVKKAGTKAGDATVSAYQQVLKKRGSGEGSPGYEFGFKSGQAIGGGLNRWASSGGGKGSDPIGKFIRSGASPVNVGREYGEGVRKGLEKTNWKSVGEKVTRKMAQGATDPRAKNLLIKGFHNIWSNIRGDADSQTGKTAKVITHNLNKGAEGGKKSQSRLKTDLANIWKAVRGDADTKWGHVFTGIRENTDKAKTSGTKNNWDLKGQLGRAWKAIQGDSDTKWGNVLSRIQDSTRKSKEQGTRNSWDLKKQVSSAWQALQKAAPGPWNAMSKTVAGATSSMVSKVRGFWSNLIGFINKVLKAVNLPTINIHGGSSGGSTGNTNHSAGNGGRGGAQGLAVRVRGFASGGMVDAFAEGGGGGMARPHSPRMHLWGEGAHDEGFITTDPKYRKENLGYLSTIASRLGQVVIPASQGSGGRSERPPTPGTLARYAAGGLSESQLDAMRGRGDQALGHPYAHGVAAGPGGYSCSGLWNWIVTGSHGSQGGTEAYYPGKPGWKTGGGQVEIAVTMSGGGGPDDSHMWGDIEGTPYESTVAKGVHHGTRAGSVPGWMGGGHGPIKNWHIGDAGAAMKGGGAGGGIIESLWDTAGNALWNRLVQPKLDAYKKSLSGKFVLAQAAGQVSLNAIDAIKNWIIGESGTSGSGSGAGSNETGGGSAENRALGKKMLADSSTSGSWGALDKLFTRESGWDRFAANPTSTAYGIPQNLHPETYPKAGQKSGGSHAGPQIGWGLNYIDERYGSTDKAWGHSQSTGWYAKGGIAGRDGMKLSLPGRTARAFHLVAATLKRVAGSVPSLGRLPDGGMTKGLVGIAGEDGEEAVISKRRTPETMQALRVANKWHGEYARGGMVPRQGWDDVGRDNYLGIGGPAASSAMKAMRMWRGAGPRYGKGRDISVSWSEGKASGMTSSSGRVRVDRHLKGTAVGMLAMAHELGHVMGLGHDPARRSLMHATIGPRSRVTSGELRTLKKMWGRHSGGGPRVPHSSHSSSPPRRSRVPRRRHHGSGGGGAGGGGKKGSGPAHKYQWDFARGHHDKGGVRYLAHGRPRGVLGGGGGAHSGGGGGLNVGDHRLAGSPQRRTPRIPADGSAGGGRRDSDSDTMRRIERHLKSLDEQGVDFRHIEDLLQMALRVQDSPAGVKGSERRHKARVRRERARL